MRKNLLSKTNNKLLVTKFFLFVVGVALMVCFISSNHQEKATAAPIVQEFKPQIPAGIPIELWNESIPADNPMTAAKIALGEKLYFDKRLSIDKTVSCATCHDPATALADINAVGVGIKNQKGARNSPSVINSMFNEVQFWDGRALTLEDQAKLPLINPIEMGMPDHKSVVARVQGISEYEKVFALVFGKDGITIDTIAKAIAAFERTQLSGNSPFDRFIAGDQKAISDSAKRGWELFNGKARCISCHTFNKSAPFFSDFKFHNIGVAAKDQNFPALVKMVKQTLAADPKRAEQLIDELALAPGFSELGRYLITKELKDLGTFKTPMLRDIELTPPYMHNGSEKTLLDVVVFYNKGGELNPNLDGGMRPLKLTDPEMSDLVELMKTFTSDESRRKAQTLKPQTRAPFPQ